MNINRAYTTWILSSGRTGSDIQCISLASALQLTPCIKRLSLRFPWSFLPEPLWIKPLKAYTRESDSLYPPWPDIVIGSGRCSSVTTAKIKEICMKHKKKCFAIQILDPRISSSRYDCVIAPTHSHVKGPNVLQTLGSLHPYTSYAYQKAYNTFSSLFSSLPKPIVLVLIGGKNRYYQYDSSTVISFAQILRKMIHKKGGSLLVSASRRTPSDLYALIKNIWEGLPVLYTEELMYPNLYPALIGAADSIVVTPDSVSMTTEACASGKIVLTPFFPEKSKRLRQFHTALQENKYTFPLCDTYINNTPKPQSFNDLEWVTPCVHEKINAYFQN